MRSLGGRQARQRQRLLPPLLLHAKLQVTNKSACSRQNNERLSLR